MELKRNRTVLMAGLLAVGLAAAAEIPARKLELIRQAMASMKLDLKIRGLVDGRTEARLQKIRIGNSVIDSAGHARDTLSDSLAAEIRATIAGVYAENLERGRDGLYPRVYAVFNRYLTEEDLKFAVNFNSSDNGKRYREVAPRIVNESVEVGRRWGEELEPEIWRRLEGRFRGSGLKF